MDLLTKLKIKKQVAKISVQKKEYWDSIVRKVSPSTIEEFPEYIKINDQILVKCILVGVPPSSEVAGYPADLNPRLIDELLSISSEGYSIAYSFCAIPISNVESMKMLDEAMFRNRVSQESYRDVGKKNPDPKKQPPLKKVLEEEDFVKNYREIFKNEQKMLHTAFIIIMWGRSDKELREAESHVTMILEANRVYYEIPTYRQLDSFIAAQPYPFWADFSQVELFSHHTATLAATRNPNSRTDDNGLYLGDDLQTGKNIIIDLKSLAASHLMFVGPTGSGKTFTLLMLLMRAYDMLDKKIFYITPKPDVSTDYRNVARYYGDKACIIDIGPNGNNINPLQVLINEEALGNDYRAYIRAFDEHMELLDQFFEVLFAGTKTVNMSSYINETLIECYRRKGIERENPDTWKNVVWPTLLDLRTIWAEDAKDPKNATANAVADKTFFVNTSWSYMNRPTDVNLSADFIIIDISNVPNSLQDAMSTFTVGFLSLCFRTGSSKEVIIAVDEGKVFLRNPKLSSFLLRTLTQGRSFSVSLWIATQQTADLIKADLSEEFKTNIAISIILGNMRPDTLEHVKSFYKLNENDIINLGSCGVGEGLVLVGSEVIPTKFRPTSNELEVIKGKKNKAGEKPLTDSGCTFELMDKSLLELATKYGAYFEDWFVKTPDTLANAGYEQRMMQRATSRGSVRMWVKSELIKNEQIGMESMDHYSTVLQIAAYLRQQKIPCEINYNDVDIIAEFPSAGKVAFEYERPGSHTEAELIKKKQHAETTYGKCFFIGTVENLKALSKSIGEENAVRRGIQLAELITDLKTAKTA